MLNERLKITISDGINEVISYGDIIESSLKREVTKEDITKCINKLGNTPFISNNIKITKKHSVNNTKIIIVYKNKKYPTKLSIIFFLLNIFSKPTYNNQVQISQKY